MRMSKRNIHIDLCIYIYKIKRLEYVPDKHVSVLHGGAGASGERRGRGQRRRRARERVGRGGGREYIFHILTNIRFKLEL